MQRIENEYLIGRMFRSVIDVVSRRTSGGYAAVIIGNVIKELEKNYDFLKYVEIKSTHYAEAVDVVDIKADLGYVDTNEIRRAIRDFIQTVTTVMGKQAGYFLIREIKEGLPYDYEQTIKELGIDLEMMQLQYLAERRKTYRLDIENVDIIRYVLKALFDILDRDVGRNFAISTMTDLVERCRTTHEILEYVKINDIRMIQGVDVVSVMSTVNAVDQEDIGEPIQTMIQEVNKALKEKGGYAFVDKLKKQLTSEYVYILEELGVDLHGTSVRQDLILKHVLMALIGVLHKATSQSYAVLTIDSVLKKLDERYGYMRYVKIDSTRYSDGINAVSVPSDVNEVSPMELAKAIQKMVERVTFSLGEEAGEDFVNRFKERLGKAYLSKIEQMGVNLHMIQLRQEFL
jgi:hypothetical protein